MSVALYMDVHVSYAITTGLRLRGVDVLTAQEDGAGELDDRSLLSRASEVQRVLITHDDDLLREAHHRQESAEIFSGVIYGHQLSVTIGQCVDDLELVAKASEPDEWINRVEYLPLK